MPGVSAAQARGALQQANYAFQNVRGRGGSGAEVYFEYIKTASAQVRMLAGVLPAADLDRILTTPRYWMLQSLDPTGRGGALAALMDLELDEKVRLLEGAERSLTDDADRLGRAQLIVVPDTNFFLHHSDDADTIPWGGLATPDVRQLLVAIPILVVDELDKAKLRTDKIADGKQSVRTRARRTLTTFEQWFAGGLSTPLVGTEAPAIEVALVLDDPGRARLPDADYEIIDNARALRDLTGARVLIATFDSGMRLRARAAGVQASAGPDRGSSR